MSEEEVRRLLARARHTTPVPDDVAARVDAALSQAAPPGPASPVVDLDARRRRRVTGALAAAAVVVVAGVGLGASGALDGALDGSGGSAESSAGSGSPDASDRSGGGTDGGDEAPGALDAPRDPGTSDGGGRSRFDAESGEGSGAARGGGRPVVRDGSTLVADLVDAARSARPDLRVVAPCAPRAVEGERVRVRFEPGPRGAEVPAEVVLVAAEDGARRAEVWSCAPGAGDAGGPLRSALLPPR